MTDPVTAVYQEFWGANPAPPPGAPKAAPADAYQIYQGADPTKNVFGSWWVWDIRGGLFRLIWDLLRFQLIDNGKGNPDRTVPIGLRDSVNEILYKTDRTLAIVELLAANAKVDISALP